MKDVYKTLMCLGIGLAIGFAVCWFAIVQPAGARASAALTKSNALAEQYRKQAADSLVTIAGMSTTIEGQKSDISKLSGQIARIAGDNRRLDETNKQLEVDKGQLTSQLGFFSDYYNKSQQQDKQFGDAVDNAAAAVLGALDDLHTLQGH